MLFQHISTQLSTFNLNCNLVSVAETENWGTLTGTARNPKILGDERLRRPVARGPPSVGLDGGQRLWCVCAS